MLVSWLVLYCCGVARAADVPVATLDLSKFGYRTTGSTSSLADYSGLSFLSNDLLVVSINQRSFGSVEPTFADTPESTIIVFDVARANVATVGKMRIEKLQDSVQAISAERFAALNEKGLQFCDQRLLCEPIVPTTGPMFVSPMGKRLAVGGNMRTAQVVIDTESQKRIAVFERSGKAFPSVVAIPGDEALLLDRDNRISIQTPSAKEVTLNIDDKGTFPEFRFLNGKLLACLDHYASEAIVADVDGKAGWRTVLGWLDNRIIAIRWRRLGGQLFFQQSQERGFGVYEHGYTTLDSVLNILDFDEENTATEFSTSQRNRSDLGQ